MPEEQKFSFGGLLRAQWQGGYGRAMGEARIVDKSPRQRTRTGGRGAAWARK